MYYLALRDVRMRGEPSGALHGAHGTRVRIFARGDELGGGKRQQRLRELAHPVKMDKF